MSSIDAHPPALNEAKAGHVLHWESNQNSIVPSLKLGSHWLLHPLILHVSQCTCLSSFWISCTPPQCVDLHSICCGEFPATVNWDMDAGNSSPSSWLVATATCFLLVCMASAFPTFSGISVPTGLDCWLRDCSFVLAHLTMFSSIPKYYNLYKTSHQGSLNHHDSSFCHLPRTHISTEW